MKTSPASPGKKRSRSGRHHKVSPLRAWHYRTLIALRDHLDGAAGDRLREPFGPMEAPSLHPEDLVDELYDRELARALPSDPGAAREEIDAALERLRVGTYGRCELTGRQIPEDELRAIPWRRTCASRSL